MVVAKSRLTRRPEDKLGPVLWFATGAKVDAPAELSSIDGGLGASVFQGKARDQQFEVVAARMERQERGQRRVDVCPRCRV